MRSRYFFYFRIILAQVGAYFFTVYLLSNVFLGPVPTVRAEFLHELEALPHTVVQQMVQLPTTVKNYVSNIKKRKELASKTPPPWVFEPKPGEVIPTTSGRYTGPTRAPRDVEKPSEPNQPNVPQPTQQPGDMQPTEIPRQVVPTRTPQPTRPPVQPTSVPASPSTLEQQILELINQRRQAAGLQIVSMDGTLSNAARSHSAYMSGGHGRCGHVGQGGSSPLDRAKSAGYNGQVIGETVACGYTTAQGAVDGWWSSPPHKAILTSPQGRQIGIGWSNNYQTALIAR